jgi:hypothetical protein
MATARKKEKKAKNVALVSGHMTNLKQSIFSFDIYVVDRQGRAIFTTLFFVRNLQIDQISYCVRSWQAFPA